MIKIHSLLHVPYETPGSIEKWVKNKKHDLTATEFYNNGLLPSLSTFDWLLVMGGPMSVHDEDKHPWLKEEKQFIRSAIENDKVVIGICLGAQLIAAVLGADVYPNEHKEIGWFPIHTTIHATDHDLFSSLPRAVNVFHWHGDTFDLPEGALLLAESNACKNQLFVLNEKIIGMQFHLEVNEELIKGMVQHGKGELKKNTYVQVEDEIIGRTEFIHQNNTLLESILDNLESKFTDTN
ncbi:MAG: type 1 glutamine amidotransferase [Ignavibacteriaceae bacterium]